MDALEYELRAALDEEGADAERIARAKATAELIMAHCAPKQRGLIEDALYHNNDFLSVRCPRRSGKTFAMTALAVVIGLLKPGSRILIVSLTLKSTRENYWEGAPAGLHYFNREYKLGLKFNATESTWVFPNGSRGRLAGADTRGDIEYLRGAAAEADIAILDECKSFAPALLAELIRDVIMPGLMTREGKLVMGGTPGHLPYGVFYEATEPRHRKKDEHGTDRPTCISYEDWLAAKEAVVETIERPEVALEDLDEDPDEFDDPWILHSWSLQDNTAKPWQWKRALRIKKRERWADDNPTWLREYLGQWAPDQGGLVYAFAALKAGRLLDDGTWEESRVLWTPGARSAENPCGLPMELGPWHLVMGLDFGIEDHTALVLGAYSERVNELRVVFEYSSSHLLPDNVAALINEVVGMYGAPKFMVGDAGSLGGKVYVMELARRHGIIVEPAKKLEKYEHIEFMNSDFHAGRIKIIPGMQLDHELSALTWDLRDGTKAEILRMGKRLVEDPSCANHLCDALLYMWRSSAHYFAQPKMVGPAKGTPEWWQLQEKQAEERAARNTSANNYLTDGIPRGAAPMTREAAVWQIAASRIPN